MHLFTLVELKISQDTAAALHLVEEGMVHLADNSFHLVEGHRLQLVVEDTLSVVEDKALHP